MKVEPGVLEWLAEHVGGSGRQLDGAVVRLESLTRIHGRPPEVEVVAESFRTDADMRRATVERIAQGVGRYFRVEPRRLQERDRSRQAFCRGRSACISPAGLPICRSTRLAPISAAVTTAPSFMLVARSSSAERDLALSGAVRQLQADLV